VRKNFSTIVLALFLAVMVWIGAVREQNPTLEADYDRPVPVAVTPPASGLMVTSEIPATVRLRLIAPRNSWENLSPAKFNAYVDFSQLQAGFSEVPVEVVVSDPYVRIQDQQPQMAGVRLAPTMRITMPVEVNVLDSPPPGYINRAPVSDPAVVSISGPADQVERVTVAQVDAFVRNAKDTVQVAEEVVAKDSDNRIVFDVTLDPAEVLVTVPIQQRFGYKDIPVRVRVEGQAAPGYRVSNISVDPPTITLVGSPEGLSRLAGLVETVPVNLEQATQSVVRTVPLNLPDGVTTVSANSSGPAGVTVSVEISPIEDALTLQRPIEQQGIDLDYWWEASPDRAEVYLSGPLSQLRSLKASDVEVIVDLFNLEPGTHILQPTVFKPDGLRLDAIVPDTIEVTVGRTIQRPLRARGVNPDYTWSAAPEEISVLLAGDAGRLRQLNPVGVIATVDLTGLEPGLYQIKPTVTVPGNVTLQKTTPDRVNVLIATRPGVVISPTSTITATTVPTTTP
jgi:YbbR domain-containing protein